MKLDKTLFRDKSCLGTGKIMLCFFEFDYMIVKWGKNNVQFIYMDTDSFIPLIYTDDVYISDDVQKCLVDHIRL